MSITGKQTIKKSIICRLNNTLLYNQQITEEKKKKKSRCIETNENENTTTPTKPMGHCKNSAKGKVHSNTCLPQETRKKSNK